MTLLQTKSPSNTETVAALCGPNRAYGAELVLIASISRDDLTGFDKTKLRSRHFHSKKLRVLAESVISSRATFGVVDLHTIRRLLLTHHGTTEQWFNITCNTIERIAELLVESDITNAWEVVAA